ncbi:MAG: hypothetical protein K8F90_12065 [Hyphomicrobiales bacterium]|jgi:hypothetical protein|nr:hypothetical protein [Hyphomicrobiales bacterium]
MKRFISIFTAIVFTFAVTTQPARAFAPVAVLAAPQIVSAGSMTYAIGAAAGLIGVIGLYLTIEDASENKIRIPLGANENNQPPAPTAAATAQATQINGYCAHYQSSCITAVYPDASGAVAERGSVVCTQGVHSISGTYVNCNEGGGYNIAIMEVSSASCPTGYTNSGGTCVLQNARQVTDDKTCDLLVSMGQFATADDLNCSSTVDGSKIHPIIRNNVTIAYGQNSSGQPLMWEVMPPSSPYPNWVVRQHVQTQTETQTQVQTTTIAVDPATSEIVSVQTQTSPGSLQSPSGQTIPTSAEPTTGNTPTVNTDPNKPADKITCGLPNTPPCAIDDSGFNPPYQPEEISSSDLNKQKLIVLNIEEPSINFSWLPSFLPGDAVTCEPLEFRGAVNVGEVNLDSTTQLDLCPYLEIARNILGWLFGVASVIYIWRRFAGARGGNV